MKNESTGLLRANGWRAAAATHSGRVRDDNEDVFFADVRAGIFLVADGVGGQAAGEVAASIAADVIRWRLERQDAPAPVRVREAIGLANREILRKADQDPQLAGMACVLTLAVLDGRDLIIGHVGDTRLYRLDARGISKLTHDHSPVGELEDARVISETEAMADERRNEVYRDVGSEPRDPESDDFIELVRTRLDDDAAMLICSDGLTDMLPVLEVNRIARLHAGAPEAAAAALIAAANDAGGRDNVTVLIVEGRRYTGVPDPGRAFPPSASESDVPTLPLGAARPDGSPLLEAADAPTGPFPAIRSGWSMGRVADAVLGSRGVALVGGVVLGLLVPVIASVPEMAATRRAERVTTAGHAQAGAFPSIAAALANAQHGDVVEIAPGEYSEAITIPAGVELRAGTPGTVVLVAPAGSQHWTAIDARGAGATVRGIRIAATAAAPMSYGIVVGANDVTVDDVTLEGSIDVGVDVLGANAVVRASRFDRLAGTGVRLMQQGASLRQNVFRSAAQLTLPAVEASDGIAASFTGNVFMQFARVVEPDARADELIGHDNFLILPGPKR